VLQLKGRVSCASQHLQTCSDSLLDVGGQIVVFHIQFAKGLVQLQPPNKGLISRLRSGKEESSDNIEMDNHNNTQLKRATLQSQSLPRFACDCIQDSDR
jgi:hypothetical protein